MQRIRKVTIFRGSTRNFETKNFSKKMAKIFVERDVKNYKKFFKKIMKIFVIYLVFLRENNIIIYIIIKKVCADMSKSKKILSFFVGLMCGLACLVSGLSVGGARPLTAHAATDANGVAAASLAGYNATTKKYNYVYFGEYPQTRVLEVLPDWYNFPVFSERSMKVENEIKGYIAELNKTYYSTYLADAGNKYHAYYDANYNWETTNVLRYIPMEDYANDKIAFDYKTAYYTLLVDVYSDNSKTFGYPAGTKFYPYNYAFDSYIKLGATYTVDPLNPTYTYVNGSMWDMGLDLSADFGYRRWNDFGPYIATMDEMVISSGAYKYGTVQLLVVEPIKWRVLANQSSKVTLMSEVLIDAMVFDKNQYSQAFAFSLLKVWLNGEVNQKNYYNPKNYQTKYFSSSNWGFIDRAFSESQADKILETEIVDDKDYLHFDNAWHAYTDAGLQTLKNNSLITNGVVELNKPKSICKIFVPTRDLIGSGNVYGFDTYINRRALNCDYAVISGNLDSNFPHTCPILTEYEIGNGAYIVINNANSYPGCPSYIDTNGGFEHGTGGGVTFGLRPCFCINESDLLSSGGVIASDIIDLSVNENGTLARPVNLERTSTNAEMTYYAFTEAPAVSHSANYVMKPTVNGAHYEAVETLATPLSNPAEHNGTWEFVTTHANGANFEHVIKVAYNGQAVGEKLVARVKNSAGKIIAMNVVGMVDASGNGETYFKFLHNSGELNYTVDVFTLAGTTLTQTNILFAKNGEAEKLSTIYLDPQGLYGGSDVNLGTTADTPLKTLDYAKSRLDTNGTIHLMSTIELTEDYIFDLNGGTLKRWFGSSRNKFMGIMIKADGTASKSIKVVFKNITIDGNRAKVGENKDSTVSPIKCTYTDIFTETGSAFINHLMVYGGDSSHYGGVFRLGSGCSIIVNDAYVANNYAHVGGFIATGSSSSVIINDGLFINNTSGHGAIMYASGGTVIINGGKFGEEGKPNSFDNRGLFIFDSCTTKINYCEVCYNRLSAGQNSASVFQISGGSCVINGGYFHDNYTVSNTHASCFFVENSSLNLRNIRFENNDLSNAKIGALIKDDSYYNATINISNCTFINNTSKVGSCVYVNLLSGYTCPVTITNCTFKGNKATGSYTYTDGKAYDSGTNSTVSGGGAIYCTQPLTVTNCTFDGNEATGSGANGGAINATSKTNPSTIIDCKFIGNKSLGSGAAVYFTSGNGGAYVSNCRFEKNSSTSGSGAVVNARQCIGCYFYRNSAYGSAAAYSADTTFIDCQMIQNYAVSGPGAIGGWSINVQNCVIMENYAQIYGAIRADDSSLINNSIIKNNASVRYGGVTGVWSTGYRMRIRGGTCIYGNRTGVETYVVDGLTLPVVEDGHLVGGIESNINFISDRTHFVYYATEMFDVNCKIGLTSTLEGQFDESQPVVKTSNSSYYMGSECLDCFFCDDPDYELEYRDVLKADGTHDYYGLFMKKKDATTGTVSAGDMIDFETTATAISATDLPSYTASDFRGIYDGEDHGIDVETFTSGATVTYSTDGVTYSASKPKYNKAGTYTTYFKISASGKRTVMGTRQVVIQQPKTVLVGTVDLVTAFGTKFSVGDDVTNLIKATIHDEHGNAVDGKFTVRTAINSVAFTTTSINLTFTPTNPIYQTCNLSANVKIEYENLYYYSGNFYTDSAHTQGAIPIATKNISTILEYMKNGGTIYFLSTYETSSALTLSTSKQVNLKRGTNFRDAILQVTSSTLQIGTTTMAGQITLDGASIDGQMALIVNKGTLKMYGNVVIQNAYNTQGNASNLGGALYNTGTATIDIVKITKIRCTNGGTIHNTGTLTLSGTLITDCYSSIGGAGVYTSNKATISNVSFKNIYGWTYASNTPKGFALNIAGGTATVRNCSVQNVNCVNSSLSALSDSSYTSTMLGGGAYVAPTATLNISSTTFYNCKAYNGAGIYVEGTMVASHVTVQKSTATNFGAGLGTSNTAKVTLLEVRVISSTAKTSANETAGIYVADNAQVITMAGAKVEQPTTDVGLYLALAVCALVAIASVVIVCAGKRYNK